MIQTENPISGFKPFFFFNRVRRFRSITSPRHRKKISPVGGGKKKKLVKYKEILYVFYNKNNQLPLSNLNRVISYFSMNGPELDAGIDPGMAFYPFSSSILVKTRRDLNPQTLDHESSPLTTRPDLRP
jgi:hypothetical protein